MCKGCAKGVRCESGRPRSFQGLQVKLSRLRQCLLGGLEEGLLKIAAADRRYKWYDRHELGVWWLPEIVPS